MLLIDNPTAEKVLSMSDCLSALEEGFREEGTGAATNREKSNIHLPTPDPEKWYRYCTMEGGIRKLGAVAIRMKSDMVSWPLAGGKRREFKYCHTPGKFCGLILLFSAKDGSPLAILNDGFIQHMRVGGTGGVAAKYMARKDASVLGIIGSGGMARTHAWAMSSVRKLKSIKVYSPNEEHRRIFAQEMSRKLGLEVKPLDNPREVVQGSDIICTCTDSKDPVIDSSWLEEGMHICSVTHNEIDRNAWKRINCHVQYHAGVSTNHYTTPENWRPFSTGGTQGKELARYVKMVGAENTHTLPEVVLGKVPGRKDDRHITIFTSQGSGTQFTAVAYKTYELARAKGLGRELPLEWFLQDIRD